MPQSIYHICSKHAWEIAKAAGIYRGDTLATQGFIHFSFAEQVLATANRIFKGKRNLLILCVDTQQLRAELKTESSGIDGEFPHLYGALNLDAVTEVLDFPCNEDGNFSLPVAMR